jgi:hypothetical protein
MPIPTTPEEERVDHVLRHRADVYRRGSGFRSCKSGVPEVNRVRASSIRSRQCCFRRRAGRGFALSTAGASEQAGDLSTAGAVLGIW